MGFYNQAPKRNNDFMKQTVFSNVHECEPKKYFKYYALIEVDGVEKLYKYLGKFRSEAQQWFLEQARLDHGKFKMMGVFQN